jgi:hypothetical protein
MFYNSLKEEVKDKLYKANQLKTLDKFITIAIHINNRLYT